VATIRARAPTREPASISTLNGCRSHLNFVARFAIMICAPNFWAWAYARRREPRRACTDNDEVANVDLIDAFIEPETLGDLLITRIPQHGVAAADQHGHIGRAHMKSIEQFLGVAVEIECIVRVTSR